MDWLDSLNVVTPVLLLTAWERHRTATVIILAMSLVTVVMISLILAAQV